MLLATSPFAFDPLYFTARSASARLEDAANFVAPPRRVSDQPADSLLQANHTTGDNHPILDGIAGDDKPASRVQSPQCCPMPASSRIAASANAPATPDVRSSAPGCDKRQEL